MYFFPVFQENNPRACKYTRANARCGHNKQSKWTIAHRRTDSSGQLECICNANKIGMHETSRDEEHWTTVHSLCVIHMCVVVNVRKIWRLVQMESARIKSRLWKYNYALVVVWHRRAYHLQWAYQLQWAAWTKNDAKERFVRRKGSVRVTE